MSVEADFKFLHSTTQLFFYWSKHGLVYHLCMQGFFGFTLILLRGEKQ